MDVKQKQEGSKGRFFMEAGGQEVAHMTYTFAGDDKFIIDHTVVETGNEGKGLGKQLVKAAVEFARKNNYKIMPLCTYAKAVFDKMPEYNDVLF